MYPHLQDNQTVNYYPQNPPMQQQPMMIDNTDEPLITINNKEQYDANSDNSMSTKFIKYGSILLFIGTVFITAFLLSDVIGGSQYFVYYYANGSVHISPHNAPSTTAAKTLLMLINLVLMIASGILGIIATRDGTSVKSKYSLLHVICLSIGMIVFVSEMIIVHVSFFTSGYIISQPNSYGAIFSPFLAVFTILSVCGLACCCGCCVSGCVRYRNISAHTKEVSI